MVEPLNLREWEEAAACTEPVAWDYYRSGARDELTLRANAQAWDDLHLYPRVLNDVSQRDLRVRLLGATCALPLLIAPTAFQKLAHPDGEAATARAAARAGVIMTLSTLANTPVEEVAAQTDHPLWFQLYVYRDRGATRALVERACAAGCAALVVTVDSPQLGTRERDARNRFRLPPGLSAHNLLAYQLGEIPVDDQGSGLAAYFHTRIDPALSWRDLEWLCALAPCPVLVKGVLRADDAARAVQAGAAGVIVSNHGGRQLEDGVYAVLQHLRAELDEAMALAGCASIDQITPDLLRP